MIAFADLVALAKENQFLVGGIGTVTFGAGMYVLRTIPHATRTLVERALTTSVTVTSKYPLYGDVVAYLGRHAVHWSNRSLAPSRQYEAPRSGGSPGSTALSVGYGGGLAVYRGTLLRYQRRVDLGQNSQQNETLFLSFLTRDRSVPLAFVDEATRLDRQSSVRITMVSGRMYEEGSIIDKPKRTPESVFVDPRTKAALFGALRSFAGGEASYARRGIPYKFCAVLHGPPGTGKTSLIHALASAFDLTITYVSTLERIDQTVLGCGPDTLLVIEDVDALASNLDRNDKGRDIHETANGTMVIHALLNALDGFCTPHGLKVVLTTNHLDRMDAALLRPGRTDLCLEVGLIGGDAVRDMFAAFYGLERARLLDGVVIAPNTGAFFQQTFLAFGPEDAVRAISAEKPDADLGRAA